MRAVVVEAVGLWETRQRFPSAVETLVLGFPQRVISTACLLDYDRFGRERLDLFRAAWKCILCVSRMPSLRWAKYTSQ
jgi:hypothetical protein